MRKIYSYIVLLSAMLLSMMSCSVDSDYFGYSDKGALTTLAVEKESGAATLNEEKKSAQIFLPDGADISSIKITKIASSKLTHTDKKVGDLLNLSSGADTIWITTEDQSRIPWKVTTDLSQSVKVTEIQFEGQEGETKINGQEIGVIYGPEADLTQVKLSKLTLGSGCVASIKVGDILDLSQPLDFDVSNEEIGVKVKYTIKASIDMSSFIDFKVADQIGETSIYSDVKIIDVYVPEGANMNSIVVTSAELKHGYTEVGTSYFKEGATLNFKDSDNPVIPVTLNNGKEDQNWEIRAFEAKQLPNNHFVDWYSDEISGILGTHSYVDLGKSLDNTLWSTTNRGAAYEANNAETVLKLTDNGGLAIHTAIVDKSFPAIFQVSTGFAYTGTFERDASTIMKEAMDDPSVLAYLYNDFSARPKGVKIKYRYKSGQNYIEGKGNNGPEYGDCAEIGIAFEKWEGNTHKRIATFWIQPKHDPKFEWKEINEELVYGKFDVNPDFIYKNTPYQASEFGNAVTDIPNKVLVAFKSSAKADDIKGAEGSELDVEYIEFTY